MKMKDAALIHDMVLKGDKVLALGFDQIWIDGEFPCQASEVEGIEELAEIDFRLFEGLSCDSNKSCTVQNWISISGNQRIMMTKNG